uniref:Uncharacterized protein n=1 Tax=Rhizophora mucronata TaxID=61149 RepID=A0A2P2P1M5_RHIMU
MASASDEAMSLVAVQLLNTHDQARRCRIFCRRL